MSIREQISKKTRRTLEQIAGEKLTLGGLLLAIRKGEELSQAEFAKLLGLSRQYLCDIEHGRRFVSPKMAEFIAKKLKYSPEQFIRLCLQDIIDREGVNFIVSVQVA